MLEYILFPWFLLLGKGLSESPSSSPIPRAVVDYGSQVPEELLVVPGDIYLGAFTWNFHSSQSQLCSKDIDIGLGIQLTMASLFALENINKNDVILPNITLGVVAVDACGKGITAIGHSVKFLPGPDDEDQVCRHETFSERFDVVGILGPHSSESCLAIANLLNLYQIPFISASATSDDLSDRRAYWNFFRTVAPDSYQTRAAVDMLLYFNWTYVSVVFEETSYGYNGLALLRKYARENDICIADSHPVSDDLLEKDYDQMIRKLMSDKNARGVITFITGRSVGYLMEAGLRNGAEGLFTWFFSEAITMAHLEGFEEMVLGSFFLSSYTGTSTDFDAFIREVSPLKYPHNPWLEAIWKQHLDYSIEELEKSESECSTLTLQDVPGFSVLSSATTMSQATEIFAVAIDSLIRSHCPGAFKNKYLLKNCVQPRLLVDYVKTAVLQKPDGPLSFSEFGAIIQDYEIKQLVRRNAGDHEALSVGRWRKGFVDLPLRSLQWFVDDLLGSEHDDRSVPESVCSKPCKKGEFLILGELPCCWECRKCRNNEIVSGNGTSCTVCDQLTWPDVNDFKICTRILPTFLQWTDIFGVGLASLAGLGLLAMTLLSIIMIKFRSRKVLVGSGLGSLCVTVTGVVLMFVVVYLLIARPSSLLCITSRVGFNLSCSLVFGSLFVKTIKIYLTCKTTVEMKTLSSAILMTAIFSVQLILIGVAVYLWPIDATEKMPVLTTKFVELYCRQDIIGLLLPLAYNLFLVLLCCIFAFFARGQPENFNEAWYILLTVSMTLFAWIAFLSTYFSAFQESQKVALLGLALVLNGIITMMCFFLTKVYALFYIDEKNIVIANGESYPELSNKSK